MACQLVMTQTTILIELFPTGATDVGLFFHVKPLVSLQRKLPPESLPADAAGGRMLAQVVSEKALSVE